MIKDIKLTGERVVQIPLFSNLSVAEGDTLLQIVDIAIYREDDVIFAEGTPGTSLFVILDGTVDIMKHAPDAEPRTLARFQPYTAFGEIALLFNGEALRTATAVARERTRLMSIHKEDFARLIDFGSIVAYKIAFSISRILAARLSRVDQDLVKLMAFADETTRVAMDQMHENQHQTLAIEGARPYCRIPGAEDKE